jgi:hypothetical protein
MAKKRGVLIEVIDQTDNGMAVLILPIMLDGGDVEEVDLSDANLLKDTLYGLSTLIRRMEEANPESIGKIMTQAVNTLGELYTDPTMNPISNEEFERHFGHGKPPTPETSLGDASLGGANEN